MGVKDKNGKLISSQAYNDHPGNEVDNIGLKQNVLKLLQQADTENTNRL